MDKRCNICGVPEDQWENLKISDTALLREETARNLRKIAETGEFFMDKRCNICGVPEDQWENGFCRKCRGGCEMTSDVIVSQRVFQYADKHGLLNTFAQFEAKVVREKLERIGRKKKVPKYLREAVSCDGLSFSTLSEFPCDKLYRVCRDSLDGTFLVGDLVWRSAPKPGIPDGINFVYEAGCLDAEYCDKALQGAMFEVSYSDIPEQNR